ncbi:MAG: hypothetical protein K8H88_26230, partial [Sandaracinaceae bacterium]|nr:hypothetical protein [Sandaracinaceae bacterium]
MKIMRLVSVLAVGSLALGGCAEQPRCVNRGTVDRERIVLECNPGLVPVCGNAPYTPDGGLDPAYPYDVTTGALKPVSQEDDGSCNNVPGLCRPRPICMGAGAPICPGGLPFHCLSGVETRAMRPPRDAGPPPDGGPPPTDAGT